MELRDDGGVLANRAGERVAIEDDLVYPMLKSADLVNDRAPTRAMLVTQRAIGQDTAALRRLPKTWRYLMRNRARFERRASSIYRGKPPFSIFGVGAYTFAPWKVAIAGLASGSRFASSGRTAASRSCSTTRATSSAATARPRRASSTRA